jgi:PAS domain S-box-containing protein
MSVRWSFLPRYGLAIALVGATVGLSLLAPPLCEGSPFTLYFLVAIVTARLAGLGPAWLATALGGLAAQYFCVPPRFSLVFASPAGDVFRLVGFLVVSGLASWITSSLRTARIGTARILDSISEGFMVVNRDWRCVYANRRAAEILGLSPDDLMGRKLPDLFPAITAMPFFAEAQRAMSERRPARIEVHVRELDAWFDADLMPTGHGLSVFTREITDRKRGERKLERTLADLARSNRELDRFASAVSHDWVQPLGTIMAYAELVRSQSDGDIERYARQIADVAMRMNGLLQARRHGSKAGTDSTQLGPTGLGSVLDEVRGGLEAALAGAGLTIVVGNLPTVLADSALIHQLWHSLLSGMMRLPAGNPRTLHVESRAEDAEFRITLRLSGPGTPRETRGADPDDALTISRAIVELLGGKFETGEDERGSTVIQFTLKAASPRPGTPLPV